MDDVYAIRLAKTELREGYNTGDVNRVLSVFADGFTDMPASSPSFYGAEAAAVMRHRLTRLFARYRARLVVTIFSIRIEGSLAIDRGCHQLILMPKKGGRSKTVPTRYLDVWQKQPDGKWRISVFIDNLDVPPEMPPREVLTALKGTQAAGSHARSARKAKKRRAG
jgi:ketosteroid isomerase-like protein